MAIGCQWRAETALRAHDADAALIWLHRAQRFAPRDARIEFLLARAYRKQGLMNDVREHLQRAWNLGYSVPLLDREQWLASAQTGQLNMAEPHLAELLTDPQGDSADICEAFVNGFFLNYRLQDALRLLQPWIADFPGDPHPLVIRAKIFEETRRWQDAEQDLRHALALSPRHAEAACELGRVLTEQKQPQAAFEFYQQAANDPALRVEALLGRAKCLRLTGQAEAARAQLNELAMLDPDSLAVLLELGRLASDSGRYAEAVDILRKGFAREPANLELRYALAVALRGAGKPDEARAHFEFQAKGQAARVRAWRLISGVELNPGDLPARYEIGTIFLQYGPEDKGVIWLQSVLDYDPGHREAHARLAEYYEQRAGQSPEFAKLAKHHRKFADKAVTDSHDE